jgi:hypothetical protein
MAVGVCVCVRSQALLSQTTATLSDRQWRPAALGPHPRPVPLQDYIAAKPTSAVFLPHSAGRWAKRRFKKAQCPIVERMTNSLMMHGE